VTARAKAGTCLKIVGFNPMRDRSLRDARQAHQPAAASAAASVAAAAAPAAPKSDLYARLGVSEALFVEEMERRQADVGDFLLVEEWAHQGS
jgi:hypothetical protein